MLVVQGRKETARHHLFTWCRAWRPQIARLWKDIGKAHGWKHPRAPSPKWLWKEMPTETVLEFLRDTRLGYISTRRKLPEEGEGGYEEAGAGDEGGEGGTALPDM